MTTRVLSISAVAVVAVLLAMLAWPQGFGVQRMPPIAQLVSLRVFSGALGIVGAIVFFVLAVRTPAVRALTASIAVLFLLFTAANAAVLGVRGYASQRPSSGGGITVLEWNTLGGAPGAEAIARLAIENHATVVSLPETTRETGEQVASLMAAAGMPVQQFTVAYDNDNTAHSTTLLISISLGEYRADESSHTTAVLPTVVATPASGTGPVLVAAHTLAPIPPVMIEWQNDLRWVAGACSGPDVIVAGDFNATLDTLAGLGNGAGATLGNCGDAAEATGSAGLGTWPAGIPATVGSPIDHVLSTANWSADSTEVVTAMDSSGSDHRPTVVHLVPSG